MVRTRRIRSVLLSAGVTVVMGAVSATGWEDIAVITPSLALTVLLMLRLGDEPNPVVVRSAVVVGTLTLVWCALAESSPVGSAGISAALAVLVAARSDHPVRWGTVGLLGVVAVSALVLTTDSPNAIGMLIKLSVVAAVWMVAVIDIGAESRLLTLFEQAKDTERELSLAEERRRFAADLHDIQGHSLHAIKLKAAVAARMLPVDPERTNHELAAIDTLAAESLRTARALADDTHVMSFSEELDSVAALLSAAGIALTVQQPTGTPGPAHDAVLARVLREATTNLLRHSDATHVAITTTFSGLVVTNDGARRPRAHRRSAAWRHSVSGCGRQAETSGWNARTALSSSVPRQERIRRDSHDS
ncbi:histidine kinase [Corynebacterium sp. USCH3]|uniref:sensor histidine kinase n=1 Tax=Corynebacterium sp. USCH3 TaxID=3024840 RepID=UPI0030B09434